MLISGDLKVMNKEAIVACINDDYQFDKFSKSVKDVRVAVQPLLGYCLKF